MSPIVFDIAGDALGKLIMVLLLVHLLVAVPVGLQLDRLAGGSRVLNLVLAIVVPFLGVVIVGILALVQSIKRVGAELQLRPAGTGDPGRAAKDVAGKVMAGLGALPALAGGVLGLFLAWLKLPWDPEPLELGAVDLGLRGALALAVFCALVGLVVTLSGSARWGNVLTLWATGLLLGPVLVLVVAVSVIKGNVERASELLRTVLENAQGAIDRVADRAAAAGGASTGGGAGSGAGGSGVQLPDTEQLTAHLQGMSLGVGWWAVLILGALAYVWAFVVVFLLGAAAGPTGARGRNSGRGGRGAGGRGGRGYGADAGAGANLGSAGTVYPGTAYPGSAGSAYPGAGYPGTGGFPGAGSQPGGYPGGGSGGQWPSPPPQVGSGRPPGW